MTRFAAATNSAAQLPLVRYRLLADIAMNSSTAHVCTGVNPIAWGANTYSPIGQFGGLEAIDEAGDLYPRALRMWLSAVGSAQLSEPLSENLFGKSVKLYRTFLTDSLTNVSTPELRFQGYINACNVHLADPQRGNYFEIEVETRLRREPRSARFTKEYLWNTYSGDTFFNYINQIGGFVSHWGNNPTYFSTGTVPGRQRGGGGGK